MYVAVFELFLTLLFLLVVIHSIRRHDVKRLMLAFTLIAIIVTVEENLVMYFTENYCYPADYYLWVLNFPVAIMLAWIVVSYLGFLAARKLNNIFLGALTASSIDLILEPLAYSFGLWIWNVPAPYPTIYYFNAPTGNATGWLLLTLLGTYILKKLQ